MNKLTETLEEAKSLFPNNEDISEAVDILIKYAMIIPDEKITPDLQKQMDVIHSMAEFAKKDK